MTSGTESGTQDPWAWARDPDDEPDATQVTRPREEDWEWAHRAPELRLPDIPAAQVAAILVNHNGADWLERTLRSLDALSSRPGLVVAVETGSTDASPAMLRQAVADGTIDRLVEAGEVQSFGAAVEAALADVEPAHQWLWLLHDDAEPQPDALQQLLLRASADDEPDLLFPKLLQPRRRNHPVQLAEIGSTVTGGASRHLSISPGEIDQRQSDSARVLGGSTAAMLVRRSLWQELQGLDPRLPLFRDGQDFGWRANAAGHVVVTAPDAAVHHRQEGRFGERSSVLVEDAATTDRLLGMRLVAAHSDNPGRTLARLRVQSALRGLGYLLGKAPGEAMAEWRAARRIGADRALVQQMRTERAAAAVPTEGLRPSLREVWGSRVDRWTHSAGEWRSRDEDPDTSLDDLIGDDFAGGRKVRRVFTPGRVLFTVLVAGFLVAFRGMFGRGQLSSSQLLPAPHTLAQAWAAWLHPTAGEAGANPGWLAIAALGSTITGGSPEVFARLLVLGAPLIGAVLAHRLATRIVGPGWVAAAFASVWPALAILSGVTARGSVSGAMLVVLLPLAGLSALRWFTEDPDEDTPAGDRLRAPAALALWLGVAAQATPATVLVGLGLAVVWAITRRRVGLGVLVVAAGPVAMLLPWLPRLVDHPGRFLTGSDPTASLPGPVAPAGQVVLGRAMLDGLPPIGVSIAALAGMALVAVLAVLLGRRWLGAGTVAVFTGAAAGCLAAASWATLVLVDVDGQQVRPSTDLLLLLAGGLTLVLCLLALRPAGGVRRRRFRGRLTTGALAAALGAGLVGLLGLVWAVAGQSASPLQVRDSPLPPYVLDVQDSARASRTLVVVNSGDSHSWMLTSRENPAWGAGEAFPVLASGPQAEQVAGIAARVSNGAPGDDLALRLQELGVAHLVMTGAGPEVTQAVSNAPGLTSAALGEATTAWTVQGLVSRASVVTATGALYPLPAGRLEEPGIVRVAEVPDARWVVEVGGAKLPVSADPSGFGIRADAAGHTGTLAWFTRPSWGAVVAHLLVLLLLLVLAAPTARRPGARPVARRSLETPRRGM